MNTVESQDFTDLKPGDRATRMLAGTIAVEVLVDKADDTLIYAKGGWTFERNTGFEYDPELSWGTEFGATGSFLIKD